LSSKRSVGQVLEIRLQLYCVKVTLRDELLGEVFEMFDVLGDVGINHLDLGEVSGRKIGEAVLEGGRQSL
jgi:hypothetical protein